MPLLDPCCHWTGADPCNPDNGCNLETFANADMLDIESLGPLVKVGPGGMVEHTEIWDLVSGVGRYVHPFEIDKVVLPKVPPR